MTLFSGLFGGLFGGGDKKKTSNPTPGTIVQTYPDGTAMIYSGLDAYGDPKYEFIDITDAGGGGSKTPPSIISVQPAGYGKIMVTYSDGSQELQTDQGQTAQELPSYLSEPPTGFVPVKDAAGNIIDWKSDPTYQLPPDPKSYFGSNLPTGYEPVYDTAGNIVDYKPARDYVSPFDERTYGEDVRRFDIGQGNVQQNFAENVRQYDADLVERVAGRQQRLQELNAELASRANIAGMQAQVDRERIQSEIQRTQMQIDGDLKIAGITDKRERYIAYLNAGVTQRGQDVSQRGQDIGYQTDIRGQDVTRELGLRGLASDYYSSALDTYGRDPVRGTYKITGGEGEIYTPGDYALSEMRKAILPPGGIQAVGPAPALPGQVPLFKAAGGMSFSGGDRGARNILVGEQGQEIVRVGPDMKMREIIPITGHAAGGWVNPLGGASLSYDPDPTGVLAQQVIAAAKAGQTGAIEALTEYYNARAGKGTAGNVASQGPQGNAGPAPTPPTLVQPTQQPPVSTAEAAKAGGMYVAGKWIDFGNPEWLQTKAGMDYLNTPGLPQTVQPGGGATITIGQAQPPPTAAVPSAQNENIQAASDILGRKVTAQDFTTWGVDAREPGAGLTLANKIRASQTRGVTARANQKRIAANKAAKKAAKGAEPVAALVPPAAPAITTPVAPVAAGPTYNPDDQLIPLTGGGIPTGQAELDAARASLSKVLQSGFYGDIQPEGGYPFSSDPLFGVNLPTPRDIASRFRRQPIDVQKLMLSGYGMRNRTPEQVLNEIRSFTPTAIPVSSYKYRYG